MPLTDSQNRTDEKEPHPKQDHNVIAVLSDGDVEVSPDEEAILVEFVLHVFDHKPGKTVTVGRFLGPEQALDYVRRRTD